MAVAGMALEIAMSEGETGTKEALIRGLLAGLSTDELASLQIACENLRRISSEMWKDAKRRRFGP